MEASRSESQVVCYVSQLALKTQVLLMVPSWFLSQSSEGYDLSSRQGGPQVPSATISRGHPSFPGLRLRLLLAQLLGL